MVSHDSLNVRMLHVRKQLTHLQNRLRNELKMNSLTRMHVHLFYRLFDFECVEMK